MIMLSNSVMSRLQSFLSLEVSGHDGDVQKWRDKCVRKKLKIDLLSVPDVIGA